MHLALVQRLYRQVLLVYPAAFRARYAEEMIRVFDDGLHAARSSGAGSTLRYYSKILIDLIGSATRERLFSMNKMPGTIALISIVCGCLAAYVDFLATEVQSTLL